MTIQYSVASRNAQLDAHESATGTAPKFRLYSGTPPANCAAAPTGTLIAEIDAPSDWAAAASGGQQSIQGLWQVNAAADGDAGYYRLYDTAASVCHEQGNVFMAVPLTTDFATTDTDNVLSFADTTGVVVGMLAIGAGIVAPSYVLAVTPVSVTINQATTGVAGGASITFKGDLTLDNTNIRAGQTFTMVSKTLTAAGA